MEGAQQTCLLCHMADMSAVPHSRRVCCVTQETCLLCDTADMSAVRYSRHLCCITQQTRLMCHSVESRQQSSSFLFGLPRIAKKSSILFSRLLIGSCGWDDWLLTISHALGSAGWRIVGADYILYGAFKAAPSCITGASWRGPIILIGNLSRGSII